MGYNLKNLNCYTIETYLKIKNNICIKITHVVIIAFQSTVLQHK